MSGRDHDWSKRFKNPWRNYEVLIFRKFWGFQPAPFSLALLLYWCCSIIFRTFNLRNTYSANMFWWLPPFDVNCEKTSKEWTNETKVKVASKEFSFKWFIYQSRGYYLPFIYRRFCRRWKWRNTKVKNFSGSFNVN